MAINFYPASEVTGGVLGCLDYLPSASLNDGDGAVVISENGAYFYRLDSTSGATPSAPEVVIPADEVGDKRWILILFRNSLTIGGTLIDNAIVRLEGTQLKGSNVIIDNNGTINLPSGQMYLVDGLDPRPVASDEIPLVESGLGDSGISIKYSREDHVHPPGGLDAAINLPLIESGSGSIGISTRYSREDHVHPTLANYPSYVSANAWFYN